MKTSAIGIIVFSLVSFVMGCHSVSSQDRYLNKLEAPKGSGLPNGGVVVNHPTNPCVEYYYTVKQFVERMPQQASRKGRSGLYMSENSGKSWSNVIETSCFDYLYVHPKTGMLYAIFLADHLVTRKDTTLAFHFEYKIAMSFDGRKWVDITEPGMLNIGPIFQDPDNKDRVCVFECFPGPQVYQADDDKYAHWEKYDTGEWIRRHPGWKDTDYDPSWTNQTRVLRGDPQ